MLKQSIAAIACVQQCQGCNVRIQVGDHGPVKPKLSHLFLPPTLSASLIEPLGDHLLCKMLIT